MKRSCKLIVFFFVCFRHWCTAMETWYRALSKLWYSTWCLRRSIIPIGHTSSPFCWARGSSSSRTSYWARSALSANISKTWMERAARWVRVLHHRLETSTVVVTEQCSSWNRSGDASVVYMYIQLSLRQRLLLPLSRALSFHLRALPASFHPLLFYKPTFVYPPSLLISQHQALEAVSTSCIRLIKSYVKYTLGNHFAWFMTMGTKLHWFQRQEWNCL